MRWVDDAAPEARRRIVLPDTVTLDRLTDAAVDGVGYPVDSLYVETFWLPRLGPSALWVLRLDFDAFARSLGLVAATTDRSLRRLRDFACATETRTGWLVRSHLAPLTRNHVDRLPEHLQADHAAWPTNLSTGVDKSALPR